MAYPFSNLWILDVFQLIFMGSASSLDICLGIIRYWLAPVTAVKPESVEVVTIPDECVLPSRFEPDKGFFSSESQKLALGPPIIPCPWTPPNSTSLGLAHTLKQLSVSLNKHQQKKHKTSTKVHTSVFTPKFQLSCVKASVSARKGEYDARKAEARLNKWVCVPPNLNLYHSNGIVEAWLLGDALLCPTFPLMFPLIFLHHLCTSLLIVANSRWSTLMAPILESDGHVM